MRPAPSDAERQEWLRGLMGVGPTKPVGYLPLYTVEQFVQLPLEAVTVAAIGARRGVCAHDRMEAWDWRHATNS